MPLRSIWHLESILLLNRTLWVEEARLSAIRSSVYSSGFSQSWSGRWDGSTLNSTNHLWIPALTERPEREPPTSKSDRLKVGNCYLEWLLFVFLVTVDGYLLFFQERSIYQSLNSVWPMPLVWKMYLCRQFLEVIWCRPILTIDRIVFRCVLILKTCDPLLWCIACVCYAIWTQPQHPLCDRRAIRSLTLPWDTPNCRAIFSQLMRWYLCKQTIK